MNAIKIKIEKQLFDELNKNVDIILIPQRILDQIENKNKMGINSLSLQEIISIHPNYKFHQGYRPQLAEGRGFCGLLQFFWSLWFY